jgi:PIN domain nuclease of toxin-antitoxin system
MKYLLDTAVWIWSVSTPERIGTEGREILGDGSAELFFSALSAWEIAIKSRLGKLKLPEVCARYVPKRLSEQGIQALPVTHIHALEIYDLPVYHSDPFDRLLIAQAMVEGMTILTSDRHFEKYDVNVVWCGE